MSNTLWIAVFVIGGNIPCLAQEKPQAKPLISASDRSYVGINFSPDGKLLVTSGESFIAVFDTGSFKSERELRERGLVDEVVFDPDSRVLLARGSRIDTIILDAARWTPVRVRREGGPPANETALCMYKYKLYTHNESCPAAFSTDGRWCALADGHKGFRLWDMRNLWNKPPEVTEFEDYGDDRLEHVNAFVFHERYLLLGEERGYITPLPLRVWEGLKKGEAAGLMLRSTGSEPSAPSVSRSDHDSFRRHRGHVTSLSLTPDQTACISAGLDGKVCAWTFDRLIAPGPTAPQWSVPGTYAVLSADGRWLAVAEEKGTRVYEVSTRQTFLWLPSDPREGRIVRLRFDPFHRFLATISCACWECVPQNNKDGVLSGFTPKVKRVHQHGGSLNVWVMPPEEK